MISLLVLESSAPVGSSARISLGRVTMARALITGPRLLLADEPTGALDSKTSREIIDIFHDLHAQGNTIVLITHDNNIAKQAQRSVNILDGQITEVKL